VLGAKILSIRTLGGRLKAFAYNAKRGREDQEYLKECLKSGVVGSGKSLDYTLRRTFQEYIDNFNPEDYPEEIPEEITEMECTVFGHICPVIFIAEDFTETAEPRRRGRYIPFQIKMRVVRRDNYTLRFRVL